MNFDYCTASINSRVRIFRLLKNGLVSQSAILELESSQSKLREYFKLLRKRTIILLAGTAVRVWDGQSPRNSVWWWGEILVGRTSWEKGQCLLY